MQSREEKVAYIQAQTVACACECEAMKAANVQATKKGLQLRYNEKDFRELPERYGIHHNAVVGFFND